jgi:L-seryl-tRNA(Ser) seleniumtransferase
LAGLQATLRHYLLGEAVDKVPVWRMISQTEAALEERAATWVQVLARLSVNAQAEPGRSAVGGGSLPGETLPTCLVALHVDSVESVAARLRQAEPPIVTRIVDDRLVLDPRTVLPEQDAVLLPLVAEATRKG